MTDLAVEMKCITKTFPGVLALENVDFGAKRGEIHALVGENGAGKTTLMRILAGLYPHGTYDGQISICGEPVAFDGVQASERGGVVMIPQVLQTVPYMTVGENMFLNREQTSHHVIQWDRLYAQTQAMLARLNIDAQAHAPMNTLPVSKQQLVVIATALSKQARILILDEPTSSLTDSETQLLFDQIRSLRDEGVTCIYISHRLEEVLKIADRVTVLRDGRLVGTDDICHMTHARIVSMMVGREIKDMYPKRPHAIGDVVFEVKNCTTYDPDVPGKVVVDDASFAVRRGEILGLFGLIGSGRTEMAMTIFGAWAGRSRIETILNGQEIKIDSESSAIKHRIGLLTEDRHRYGLVHGMSVRENATLACLEKIARLQIIDEQKEAALASQYVRDLNIATPSIEAAVRNLSGGNQQKVIVSKWLATEPQVLILDEPTRGIDVGAKVEIFRILNNLIDAGIAIIFISSELPEIMGMSDRILVMHEGKLCGEFCGGQCTEQQIMQCATGGQ